MLSFRVFNMKLQKLIFLMIFLIFLSIKFGLVMISGSQDTKYPTNLKPMLNMPLYSPVFHSLLHLKCDLFFQQNDTKEKLDYITQYKRQRIQLVNELEVDTSCDAIRQRWAFTDKPRSDMERQFPLAFARTVFKEYLLIEQLLSVEYQPQNFYCYAVDSKASPIFKKQVHNLAKCFENVIIPDDIEYSVYSDGKNVTRSHLSCVKALLKYEANKVTSFFDRETRDYNWNYVILLQNHDIPLKTNYEMVEILTSMNGTNDIATVNYTTKSVQDGLDWTFSNLKLYWDAILDKKNERFRFEDDGKTLRTIKHTKSWSSISLSHQAARFINEELNVDRFIDQLEKSRYGMDEVFFSTLNSNLPDFPGGFTTDCLLKEKRNVPYFGRYTIWLRNTAQCHSRIFRHVSCVFAAEDLQYLISTELKQLYYNKMMMFYDYGAIHCWFQHFRQRIMDGKSTVKLYYYKNFPHVRYNEMRNQFNSTKNFKCL